MVTSHLVLAGWVKIFYSMDRDALIVVQDFGWRLDRFGAYEPTVVLCRIENVLPTDHEARDLDKEAFRPSILN
jgi:hypothetical protein